MATLIYVRDAKEKNLLLLGITEEGESARYTVSRALFASVGAPARGETVGEAEFSEIKRFDEYYRAKKKALSLLSFADASERTLADKLTRSGFARDVAAECAREMVSLGYINEERQLERLVLDEANRKLRGPMKIIPHLAAKGYRTDRIRAVMHGLTEAGEIDFTENAKRLIEKQLPADATREEKKKLLFRNGFKVC